MKPSTWPPKMLRLPVETVTDDGELYSEYCVWHPGTPAVWQVPVGGRGWTTVCDDCADEIEADRL